MKMVIITAVEEYENKVLQLFKTAGIEHFSGSSIDGYKNAPQILMNSSWFPSKRAGTSSSLFFSFTDEEKVGILFVLIKELNTELKSNNPICAVELPIERFV